MLLVSPFLAILPLASFVLNCQYAWAQLPFVSLSPNGATVAPSKRTGQSFRYDNNNGFWIFGGFDGGSKNDLWRFNRNTKTFSFIDGSNLTNSAAIQPNKPTPRSDPASWTDIAGNLWIFGGNSWNITGVGQTGHTSDTWVYNVSGSGWRLVTGSTVINQVVPGTLEPRCYVGAWRDNLDNMFYIFGGLGYNSAGIGRFQSVWKLNPSETNPTWRYTTGSNGTNSVIVSGQPSTRYNHACGAAPTSGAYCFGGDSWSSATYDSEFWRFDPTSNPTWTLIQQNATAANGPTKRIRHQVVVNKAASMVYVLFGLDYSNTILTDIKAFSILTQQWSTTVSSSTFGRDYFKADTDDRNMIHYFGGYFNNTNFNDVVALTCLPGQYNNAGICTPCPAAAWSSAFNATSCTLCSANTSSSVVGAVSINSCVSCPLYTSSPVGSTGCTCNPGYQPSNGYWACNICNPGTYKADQGNTTCTQCPANTYSSIFGATSNTTCLSCGLGAVSATGSSSCSCNVGYTVSGSSCAQCAAGNFKNTIGNGTCTQCSANTYSTSGATVCITCGPNSASSVGSSSCTCNAGYYPNGMGCSACLAGTFKSSSGNSSCTNCDVNQWSSTGAISCNSCGSGAVSVSGSASCSCDLGYTASGNTCIQCGAGTYKSAVGNGTCTQCPVNTFSSVVGATSISTCIGCGSNAGSSIGSTSCACNAGYFSSGASCIACAAGTFKGTTGNSSCTNCSTNQWSAAGASSCIGCETGAVSVAGSASCSCTSGYTPILNTCAQCPAGSYKSTIGNITCTLCASNTYSETLGATSNTTCIACGQNSESVTGSGACSCVAGYYSNASACVACPAGTYKSSTGNTTCSNCTANQASGIGSITCGSCGLGAVSNAGSNVCACDLGYAYNGTACVQCAAGSYKSTVGNVTCTQCIANSFSPVTGAIANSTCFSCGPNAVSVAGSSSCSCMVGYESNGVSCLACPAGRVKANIGNDTVCVNCLANQYSLPASSTCLQCGANTVSAAGSSFCECNAGYELVNGDCVACTAGKFKPLSGNSTCQDCAANDYSLQGALTCLQCGVNALSVSGSPNCSCNSGYFGNPFSVCQKCPVNKYRSGVAFNNTTSSDCLVCPSNSGTNGTDGATGISQCICNAGYYRDTLTGTCTPCSMDTFKSRSGNELCTVCSTGTSTGNNNGSTICSVCDAGFNGTAPNCQPCETGLTKPNAGNGACTLPATSSASPSPSATASESSSPTGNPETKPPQSPANPLAAMMGISDELFFIIVGAVGAVFVATVSVVIIIRMRRKKRQVLARQSAMKRMQTIQAMQTLSLQRNLQQSNMNTTFNSNYAQVPLLSPQANSLVPYGTSPTSHTMVSLPGRSGVGHTMSSFQPMTKTYSMNGGATTTYAGPTLATMGPNWTTRRV